MKVEKETITYHCAIRPEVEQVSNVTQCAIPLNSKKHPLPQIATFVWKSEKHPGTYNGAFERNSGIDNGTVGHLTVVEKASIVAQWEK